LVSRHAVLTQTSATIGVAIILITLVLCPSVPGEFHSLLGTAYFALATTMACRVFRAVILGIIKDPTDTTLRLSSIIRAANDDRHDVDDDENTTTSKRDKLGLSPDFKIDVTVQVDTTTDSSDGYTVWERGSRRDDMLHDASHAV
jgi:hypothetical protein